MGLTVNPVTNVRKPAAGEGRNRRLEGDEEERLIAACEEHSNPFLAWIVKLALYTAMRRGEILSLTKNDINLTKRVITLSDTKNHSVRTVPLTDNAFQTIKAALKFNARPKDTKLLFYARLLLHPLCSPGGVSESCENQVGVAGTANSRDQSLEILESSQLIPGRVPIR